MIQSPMARVRTIFQRFGLDSFILGIGIAILLAWWLPQYGCTNSRYHLHEVAKYGTSIIFLVYGMGLGLQKLRDGFTLWKLHLVVQISTFVLFPLIAFVLCELFQTAPYALIWTGIFYIAALPSTVSSSVVMVSIAKGNVPAAIFNASLSSILGVFITPLWMSFFLRSSQLHFELGDTILNIMLMVLLPVVIGAALHPLWGNWIERHRKWTKRFDQSTILLIVYTSFCDSFANHVFDGFSPTVLVLLSAGMIGLFFLLYTTISLPCHWLHFNREDTITARFCGSKKSLVHGTVMAPILFPGFAAIGIVLLPLMLYHALQLILVSMLAQKKRLNSPD